MSALTDYAVDEVQSVQLKLLSEIHAFCSQFDIAYSLTDNLLIDAMRGTSVSARYTSFTVMMTPVNFMRFVEKVPGSLAPGRALESVWTNISYPNSSAIYVATDTTYLDLLSSRYKNCGIHVAIRILRPVRSRSRNRLKGAVKAIASFYKAAGAVAPTPFQWLMLPASALHSYLLRQDVNECVKAERTAKRYTYHLSKPPMGLTLDAGRIKKMSNVSLNGVPVKLFAQLLDEGSPLRAQLDAVDLNEAVQDNVITSVSIGHKAFSARLNRWSMLKLHVIARMEDFLLWKIKGIEKDPFSHGRYLPKISQAFYRFKFQKKYAPHKQRLLSLLAAGEFREIEDILEEYIEEFHLHFKRRKILAFDLAIFMVLMELLKWQGKHDIANEALARVNPKDFLDRSPNAIKAEMLDRYLPLKPRLLTLLSERNWDELGTLLEVYLREFEPSFAAGDLLVVDMTLLVVTLEYLKATGRSTFASKAEGLLNADHMKYTAQIELIERQS